MQRSHGRPSLDAPSVTTCMTCAAREPAPASFWGYRASERRRRVTNREGENRRADLAGVGPHERLEHALHVVKVGIRVVLERLHQDGRCGPRHPPQSQAQLSVFGLQTRRGAGGRSVVLMSLVRSSSSRRTGRPVPLSRFIAWNDHRMASSSARSRSRRPRSAGGGMDARTSALGRTMNSRKCRMASVARPQQTRPGRGPVSTAASQPPPVGLAAYRLPAGSRPCA